MAEKTELKSDGRNFVIHPWNEEYEIKAAIASLFVCACVCNQVLRKTVKSRCAYLSMFFKI